MGKAKVIAETGAGQHGVATATAAALFGMECKVFMGREDIAGRPERAAQETLGAEVVQVDSGTGTLRMPMNEGPAVLGRSCARHLSTSSARLPARTPIPRWCATSSASSETRRGDRLRSRGRASGHACRLRGRRKATRWGFSIRFSATRRNVRVEAAGHGIKTCKHAATLGKGSVGVLHGSKSYVLQDEYGQIKEAHSVSAGLDYPGVGPEHAWLKDSGRVRYEAIDDGQALSAFQVLCSLEGIIPAM